VSDERPGLIVYGAGGHGQVVAEAAEASGWHIKGVCDDNAQAQPLNHYPMLPAGAASGSGCPVHVAIGDNATRQRVTERLIAQGCTLATVIHPGAWVSPSAVVGEGVYVGPMAVVNAGAAVERGCVINSAAVVEHDTELGAYAHVGPNAAMGAGVCLGERALLGVGASVRPCVTVGSDAVVGAGAAVVSGVADGVTVMGVPARGAADRG